MSTLVQNWWVLVLRGVLAVLFGVLTYLQPEVTVTWFVLLFGAYALFDGVASLVAAFRPAPGASRGALVLHGVLGVLAGVVAFALPGLSAVTLLYLVALWAVATGVAEIAAAVALRKAVTGEWLLALSGALSVGLGLYMFARPAAGLIGVAWAIATYAVAAGVALVVSGFQLRSWAHGGARTLAV